MKSSSRPPLLCLLVLAAALAAGCSVQTRKAQNTPESAVAPVLATQSAEQGVKDAVTPLEVIQATPTLFLEPTTDPALAAALQEAAAARQAAEAALKSLNDQNERMAASNRAAAEANERAAQIELTRVTKDGEIAVTLAQEVTAQMYADVEIKKAQAAMDDAAAAMKKADAAMIQMVAFVAAFVALMLVLVRVVSLRPVAAPPAQKPEWKQTGDNTLVRTGSSADDSLQVDDEALKPYLEYALRGGMLGVNNAINALRYTVDKADVEAITEYVRSNGYCSPVPLPVSGGATNIINAAGEQWARRELERINSTPSPDADIPQNSTPAEYERAETRVFDGGEVVDELKDEPK